jgi:hypothetical protein
MTISDPAAGPDRAGHLTPEDLAAYLGGSMAPGESLQVEGHLSACRSCRHEMVNGRRLLRSRPRERPWLVGAAAAAAVAMLLLRSVGTVGPGEDVVRSEGAATEIPSRRIGVVTPVEGGKVAPGDAFVWHAEPDEPLYRVTIADASGRSLWTGDTADTTFQLPTDLPLAQGERYFWFVDALSSKARSLTSGTYSFQMAP